MADLFKVGGYPVQISDVLAGLALGVSLMAAAFTRVQAVHARRQADAATGELPPDFSLSWQTSFASIPGELEDALLRIANWNRRPIQVRRIKLLEPAGASISVFDLASTPSRDAIQGREPDSSTLEFDYAVPGRNPSGDAPLARFSIMIGEDTSSPARMGSDGGEEIVRVAVDYDLLGTKTKRSSVVVEGYVSRRGAPERP